MVNKKQKFFDGLQREQQQELEHKARMKDVDARAQLSSELAVSREKVRRLEQQVADLQTLVDVGESLKANPVKPYKITRTERSHKTKEAVAGLILSDLHFEEHVDPREVNGLNEYNLAIAIERCDRLVVGFDWYLQMLRGVYKVRKLFVPCAGDNVTNWLHGDEDTASNFLTPNEALVFARDRLIQIFDGLLAIEGVDEIFVPMVPGNHDRMPNARRNPHRKRTQKSLVFLLAEFMRLHYKDEPRIKFELSFSAQHYTNVFGHDVRTVHGDDFSYQGGVGGIYVPGRRYVTGLNSTRVAPVTVFGHHHQFKVDRDWISNGSLIGFSSYAANKAMGFEPAGQVAFALDRDRGKRLAVLLQVQQADTWQ